MLDKHTAKARPIGLLANLVEPEIGPIAIKLITCPIGDLTARQIMAVIELYLAVASARKIAQNTGKRVADFACLILQPNVQLRTFYAKLFEQQSRGPFNLCAASVGQIAARLCAISERDKGNTVFNPALFEKQSGGPPRAKRFVDLGCDFPCLIGDQLIIASIGVVIVEKHARQKVAKGQLPYAPFSAQHNVKACAV